METGSVTNRSWVVLPCDTLIVMFGIASLTFTQLKISQCIAHFTFTHQYGTPPVYLCVTSSAALYDGLVSFFANFCPEERGNLRSAANRLSNSSRIRCSKAKRNTYRNVPVVLRAIWPCIMMQNRLNYMVAARSMIRSALRQHSPPN